MQFKTKKQQQINRKYYSINFNVFRRSCLLIIIALQCQTGQPDTSYHMPLRVLRNIMITVRCILTHLAHQALVSVNSACSHNCHIRALSVSLSVISHFCHFLLFTYHFTICPSHWHFHCFSIGWEGGRAFRYWRVSGNSTKYIPTYNWILFK